MSLSQSHSWGLSKDSGARPSPALWARGSVPVNTVVQTPMSGCSTLPNKPSDQWNLYWRRLISHKLVKDYWKTDKKSEVCFGTFVKLYSKYSLLCQFLEDPDTTCEICLTSWFKSLVQSASCSQLHPQHLSFAHPEGPQAPLTRLILLTILLNQKIQCNVICVLWNLWLETNLLESIYYHPSIANMIVIIDRQWSLQILYVNLIKCGRIVYPLLVRKVTREIGKIPDELWVHRKSWSLWKMLSLGRHEISNA